MNISKITQPIINSLPKAGKAINGDSQLAKGFSKGFKLFEANGADNSFFGLATIMGLFVVVPRVKSALKRNPDNKEATNDEIKEILFRDLQTIAIILFGLKSMNALVSNLATKFTGIPMANNPYKKVFGKDAGTLLERGKNFLSNAVSTISPMSKATRSMNAADVASNMSYGSRSEIVKYLNSVESLNGDKKAVFRKIKQSAINSLEATIKELEKNGYNLEGKKATQAKISELTKKIQYFKDLTLDKFMDESINLKDEHMDILCQALKNKKTNALAKSVNGLNSYLKTIALAIEVGYLGFGLPALNQKRLEKKYLSEKPVGTVQGDTFTPLNDKHVKAQEIKLYSQFIK